MLTNEVLKDREHIEATVEGLNIRVRELLLLKDRVDQERKKIVSSKRLMQKLMKILIMKSRNQRWSRLIWSQDSL